MTDPTTPRAAAGDGPESAGLVRSEEELRTSVRRAVSGRVRLRRRIVTETVTRTVEVRREILEVERLEAQEDAAAQTASPGPREPLEIVLREEHVELVATVVPYERVLVLIDDVAGEVTVQSELRHEEITRS